MPKDGRGNLDDTIENDVLSKHKMVRVINMSADSRVDFFSFILRVVLELEFGIFF